MDIIWIAFALHLIVAGGIGFLIATIGRHRLPAPWNNPSFTVAISLCIGALITMATYQHWRIYPG
ncbi:hypothetical protein VW35_16035 [Devosia soli]|uniref:Uncharacterized protein n=1 Tax=Devosia soli TaxID=361041 RepID=A0A0F5L3P7_9HYPH|nr:hypothetical protein [Devosia soli]KKB76993.1 hypothetical protein VW35_16035 [Devosia soli]